VDISPLELYEFKLRDEKDQSLGREFHEDFSFLEVRKSLIKTVFDVGGA
jgi:hypothetical protein